MPDEQSTTGTLVSHVRLFPNRPDVRWEHRVHEQILLAVRRSGGELRHTDIVIRHVGYVDGTLRQKKLERDLRLLRLEEAEQPEHPFTLFNLGMVMLDLGRFEAALGYLRKSLALSDVKDSIVRKLYAMLARCRLGQGERRAALAEIGTGRQHYPDDEELLWLDGLYREEVGDLEGAEATLRRLVEGNDAEHLGSTAAGLRPVKGREALGRVCFRLGRLTDAVAVWTDLVAVAPGCVVAWLGLADAAAAEQRWADAEGELRRVLELEPNHAGAQANLAVVLRQLRQLRR